MIDKVTLTGKIFHHFFFLYPSSVFLCVDRGIICSDWQTPTSLAYISFKVLQIIIMAGMDFI